MSTVGSITDHRPRNHGIFVCIRADWENGCPLNTIVRRRSTTKDLRNRPGESRLGERRASDWLSHDLPEVPEAIQNPPLLASLRYNFHGIHEARERVSLSLFPSSHDFSKPPLRRSFFVSQIPDPLPLRRFFMSNPVDRCLETRVTAVNLSLGIQAHCEIPWYQEIYRRYRRTGRESSTMRISFRVRSFLTITSCCLQYF